MSNKENVLLGQSLTEDIREDFVDLVVLVQKFELKITVLSREKWGKDVKDDTCSADLIGTPPHVV